MYALEGRPSPFIHLSAYTTGGSLTIEVHDNGKGIPAKELNEIFVPFFSTRKDGSGIGLSLSKQIVSLHGGTIKVSSQEGKGTSFYLRFGDVGRS
ncbi:MAG: HAMP domain-containing histidine kinase [Cyclobacteriaceae bacterium]|nr:HAMP domain-containing histidine kinase [Cyclobacteriaceae bacterium]